MPALSFQQVDVFTAVRFQGNPVAVVLDADGLSTAQMQQIANWTNLSETTFMVAATMPGADYHVRIFTPTAELPFAGHPTIGTAHALLEAGRVTPRDGRLVQQCKKGLVDVQVAQADDGARRIGFTLPEAAVSSLDDTEVDAVAALLGAQPVRAPLLIDVGARWVVMQLADAAAVLAVQPDLAQLRILDEAGDRTGVVIFGNYPAGGAADIEMRAFAPAHGMGEDPVCGSGAGCLGVYLRDTGQVLDGELVLGQGQVVGRDGKIRLAVRPSAIQVGGNAVTCVAGTLDLS
jgi:PhzF family phenazine biosynthesis protein